MVCLLQDFLSAAGGETSGGEESSTQVGFLEDNPVRRVFQPVERSEDQESAAASLASSGVAGPSGPV